jgi:hypothetical protein
MLNYGLKNNFFFWMTSFNRRMMWSCSEEMGVVVCRVSLAGVYRRNTLQCQAHFSTFIKILPCDFCAKDCELEDLEVVIVDGDADGEVLQS